MSTFRSLALVAAAALAACAADPGAPSGGVGSDPPEPPQPRAGGAARAIPALSAPSPPHPVTVDESGGHVRIASGALVIDVDEASGRSTYASGDRVFVSGAYASVDLGANGGYVASTSYASHALAGVTPIADAHGRGKRVRIESTSPGRPTIAQVYSVYEGESFFFVEEEVESATPIASSYLGAIIVDAAGTVTPGPGPDPRVLDVPFDNDEWVRFDSRVLGDADFSGTGYEVTAVYESASRRGLVLGSVTHDFWKTGIYYEGTKGRLRAMNVWGGAATPDVAGTSGPTYGKDGTHDVAKHGAMRGTKLVSPRIFVGYFDDYRDGLEAYGRANAVIAPAKTWSGGAPFGWLSWGAFGLGVTAANVMSSSDFIASELQPRGFGDHGDVYVNIDAGLKTDVAPLVAYIHAKGQKVGTYRAPFSYFFSASDPSPLSRTASGAFTYGDIVLRDDSGNPIKHNGAYALDVTHPGTRALVRSQMESVVSGGFDYLKLDFLTNGALEGRHFDPNIQTGIQAYNQAMAFIGEIIGPRIFVSLSIAPIFPSQYGHARRISCDVVGQLNDLESPAYPHYGSTEYLLNALTFGWWMNKTIYAFNDPDAMALVKFEGQANAYPESWAQTRVTASAIAGTVFLDSTDYATAPGADRARALLTNSRVNDLVRRGRAFRPLEGNPGRVSAPIAGSTAVSAGSAATDAFVLDDDGGAFVIALFNFDAGAPKAMTIDLARAGMNGAAAYDATDVWSNASLGKVARSLSITLAPGEARLISFRPASS